MFILYLRIWTQLTPKRKLLKDLAEHGGTHVISTLRNPAEAREQVHV